MTRISDVLLRDGVYLALSVFLVSLGYAVPIPAVQLALMSAGVVLAVTSLVAAVLDGVDGWRDKELQREQARARLPRYAPIQPARATPPDDKGETPTPRFLDVLFDKLTQDKADKLPSVRELATLAQMPPNQVQAMVTRLTTWGAVVERTERGASGKMVWNMVRCRERMIAEKPEYAPRITPEGKVENT